jgi:hypothetical protein
MLNHLQQTIQRYATGRTVLVFLCCFGACIFTLNVTEIPFGLRALISRSGGLNILDMRTGGYTPDEAYELFEALGAEGRKLYGYLLLADILLPLIGALFFALCIAWLLRRLVVFESPIQRFILLPFVTMIADFAENADIAIMMLAFPRRLDVAARLANFFTVLKSGAGLISVLVIVVCVVIRVWQHGIFSRRHLRRIG